jgi:hypothetical protein
MARPDGRSASRAEQGILVDGKVISAPIVRATFRDQATITGLSSKEEAERIVKAIKGK